MTEWLTNIIKILNKGRRDRGLLHFSENVRKRKQNPNSLRLTRIKLIGIYQKKELYLTL